MSFSSDLVFDGAKGSAYDESDEPSPASVYGTSKVLAEQAIAGLSGDHLVIRTAAFFSPHDPHNFAMQLIDALRSGRTFETHADRIVSPTYVPHLCDAVLDLLIDAETGVWHLTNGEGLSWAAFAERIARQCGLDPRLILPSQGEAQEAARGPSITALVSRRSTLLPPLNQALAAFARELAYNEAAEPVRCSAAGARG